MSECSDSPEPPSPDELTDEEAALYILQRCRELERLMDALDNETVARLLAEARDRLEKILNRGGPYDA